MKTSHKKTAGRKIITVLSVLLCILLIPILIINLVVIIQSFVAPDEVPGFLGHKPLIVLSGSMEPAIYPGDIVVVREVSADSLNIGDVIAYRSGTSVITHRISSISSADGSLQFTTKGDNNNIEDAIAVTGNMLEGKYLFRIAGIGHAAMFMQTPVGMIIFIAIPLILFIIYDLFRRRHFEKREKYLTAQLEAELALTKQKLADAEGAGQNKESQPIIEPEQE